ncbi:helicase associated domain-containing protein [Nakamurella alba]|uniref:helicase associated domain-containing protein n=1 Tax=Nakamurella alba TaxID=2665158 RepID=UPI00389967EB
MADDRWRRRLDEAEAFVLQHGRFPRTTQLAPPQERHLGQWIYTQRRELRGLSLTEQRQRNLDRQLRDGGARGTDRSGPVGQSGRHHTDAGYRSAVGEDIFGRCPPRSPRPVPYQPCVVGAQRRLLPRSRCRDRMQSR